MAQNPWHLGQTSEHYETGGRGPGSISHTPGDPGGASYGLSQFALNTGTLREYLNHSRYADSFKGLELGSSAFDAKWREVAKADPINFAKDQHDFTKTQFYDAQSARLKTDGLDLSQRGPAVQDALWSTSVQFRGLTPSIFEKGLEEKFGNDFDLTKLSDKDIVGAVQDYKIVHNDHLFSHSSTAVKASVLARAREEKVDLLNLAEGNTVEHAQPSGPGHTATSTQEQGTHGHAVATLQTNLTVLGYTVHNGKPLTADGIFGLDTRHAVERFQHDHHLPVDGKVGPVTQQAMHTALQQITHALNDPKSPDHALFKQALTGVHNLNAHGQPTVQQQHNLAVALVVEAKHQGFARIDQVVLGDDGRQVYIAQHPASSMEQAKFGSVDTVTALQAPIAQSAATAASLRTSDQAPPTLPELHQPDHNTLAM
ncbi:VgrG-related protein [Rhodanobacter hydrolyticus]|uniref:Peptidoglycan-binding protein n=1 Tax=Rhodanobacter hydrolyticus TaxID=2250595 RepID=A0ABW8J8W2_9GAMM